MKQDSPDRFAQAYDPITDRPVTERGDWLATSRGGMWSIDHPHPRDVSLDDIAWGMARTCRYGGQLKHDVELYSVAEHSSAMTRWAVENGVADHLEDALAILLHDASEAYFGDIPTPLKRRLPYYKELEAQSQAVIMDAFGLTPENTRIAKAEIKSIDERIRIDERRRIIEEPAMSAGLNVIWEKNPDLEPLGVEVDCMLPSQARAGFLSCVAWCCERLPARDPEVAARLRIQLEIAGLEIRSVLPETARDPFEDTQPSGGARLDVTL